MRVSWLAFSALISALPTALAAKSSDRDTLVKLAAQGGGIIRLDSKTFDILTAPSRDWSSSIHLTALDKKRRCTPCKCVHLTPCVWFLCV